jgi:hypothetical protein
LVVREQRGKPWQVDAIVEPGWGTAAMDLDHTEADKESRCLT